MAYMGATDETRDEMVNLMGDDPQTQLEGTIAGLRHLVHNRPTMLDAENLVNVAGDIPVREGYRDRIDDFFDATWGTTEDGLKLINIFRFEGFWLKPFDKNLTTKEAFTLAHGSITEIPMMRMDFTGENRYNFLDGPAYDAAMLNYAGDAGGAVAYAMFVLPEDGNGFARIIEDLQHQRLKPSDFESGHGSIRLPVLELNEEFYWNGTLAEMGMHRAFTDMAQFPLISPRPLYVDYVKQTCDLKMNEEGTEAKAVTEIGMKVTSVKDYESVPRFHFRADRPYMFAIFDSETNLLLFAGIVGNPDA
jgi:serpin B